MKKYPVIINGVDASHLFNRYGYRTAREPVYTVSYTTLDGKTHKVVERWRAHFYPTTNGMTADNSAWLANLIMQTPLKVTYYDFDLGREVTETMYLKDKNTHLRLIRGNSAFVDGEELTFEGE